MVMAFLVRFDILQLLCFYGTISSLMVTDLDNQVPGHAYVHHLRPAEDRHEGCWASTGPRAVTPEGSG